MGLYLCVFDGDDELDGVEIGAYADFSTLRNVVVRDLEARRAGSRFPTFILHADNDGEWTPSDCAKLHDELRTIESELARRPPFALSGWQAQVARSLGLVPSSALECFFDVDGEPLLERLRELAALASKRGLPILFQ